MEFDPNATASADSGIFGLPHSKTDAKVVLLPVPWEVTTSYGDGASLGPEAILQASHQVDLFDLDNGDFYRHGIFMEEPASAIVHLNDLMKRKAKRIVAAIETGHENEPWVQKERDEINQASDVVNSWVFEQADSFLAQGKLVGVIGGDHSCPFGAIQAVAKKYPGFGILHVDAHADLRPGYQGFTHSHASIHYNVMEKVKPKKLVQVGIRDFSAGEHKYIQNSDGRIQTFFDRHLQFRQLKGESWWKLCQEIVSALPGEVYISFDIDGLTPDLCPNTGTPVPGGLSFDQALMLLASVAESGRKIVAFDLCEVAQPEDAGEWNGNVGARLLFQMCGWALRSHKL